MLLGVQGHYLEVNTCACVWIRATYGTSHKKVNIYTHTYTVIRIRSMPVPIPVIHLQPQLRTPVAVSTLPQLSCNTLSKLQFSLLSEIHIYSRMYWHSELSCRTNTTILLQLRSDNVANAMPVSVLVARLSVACRTYPYDEKSTHAHVYGKKATNGTSPKKVNVYARTYALIRTVACTATLVCP